MPRVLRARSRFSSRWSGKEIRKTNGLVADHHGGSLLTWNGKEQLCTHMIPNNTPIRFCQLLSAASGRVVNNVLVNIEY